MSDYETLFQFIKGIGESLQSLNQQAVREYTTVVDSILRSHSRDTGHIERTLDGLLDFCGYQPAIVLYKRLCRHYWAIDQVATTYYVNAYREMWDSNDEKRIEETAIEPEGRDPLSLPHLTQICPKNQTGR
jgi:hypothetical protein